MSVWMKGADVANAMKGSLTERAEALKSRGILPFLSIVRVGSRPDDLSYERGARKRMESDRYRMPGDRASRRYFPGGL